MKNLLSNLRLGAIFGLLGLTVVQQMTIRRQQLDLIEASRLMRSAHEQLMENGKLLKDCADRYMYGQIVPVQRRAKPLPEEKIFVDKNSTSSENSRAAKAPQKRN